VYITGLLLYADIDFIIYFFTNQMQMPEFVSPKAVSLINGQLLQMGTVA
jgi:hypothetical protein